MDEEQRQQALRLSQYRDQVAAQNAVADAEEQMRQNGQPITIMQNQDPMIYSGLYAPSGIDMMKILIRVASRPNPTFNLGAVDSSCSLTLCDLLQPDSPIIYVSEPFLSLTQYSEPEVIGRNCRFLQSPDGRVAPGSQRLYTDSKAVHELKRKIGPGVYAPPKPHASGGGSGAGGSKMVDGGGRNGLQEVQVCLKNYKKGGKLFENLLTVVPIAWEDGGDIRYVVGFQVDRASVFN